MKFKAMFSVPLCDVCDEFSFKFLLRNVILIIIKTFSKLLKHAFKAEKLKMI